jgi:hypothetical protein
MEHVERLIVNCSLYDIKKTNIMANNYEINEKERYNSNNNFQSNTAHHIGFVPYYDDDEEDDDGTGPKPIDNKKDLSVEDMPDEYIHEVPLLTQVMIMKYETTLSHVCVFGVWKW